MIPRGIRNKNPGNIRYGRSVWRGEIKGADPSFIVFASMPYGIRAIALLLLHYQRRLGLNTVKDIIGRWAPAVENNTPAYVFHVCKELHIGTDQPIKLSDPATLSAIVRAIILHENGTLAGVSDIDIAQGVNLALYDRV